MGEARQIRQSIRWHFPSVGVIHAAAAVSIALSVRLHAQTVREVTCYRLSGPVELDGNLSDAAWHRLPIVTGFYTLANGFAPEQTELRLGWTDDSLYLAFRCAETAMDKVVVKLKDGEALWMEDCAEVFLQPVPGRYFQFDLNLLGSRTGFVAAQGRDLRGVQVAGLREADGWTLEVSIPFQMVEALAEDGAVWRGNFCRIRYAGEKNGASSSVAPMQQSNHEPEHFAHIVFSSRILTPAEAAELARQDPAITAYRKQVGDALTAALTVARQSAAEIREAERIPRFQREAQVLSQQLTQMQALQTRLAEDQRRPLAASLCELSQGLSLARTFGERAQDLRYSVLILKLLPD